MSPLSLVPPSPHSLRARGPAVCLAFAILASSGDARAAGNDLLEACRRLADALVPFYGTIEVCSVLTGFCLVGVSLAALRRRTEERRSCAGPLAGVFLGALLVSVTTFIDMLTFSLFGASAPAGLASVSVGATEYREMIRLSVIVVMLVGLFQVVKGFVLLKQHADGSPRFWPAVTHILGGTLCVNIRTVMLMLGQTVGGPLQKVVTQMLGS